MSWVLALMVWEVSGLGCCDMSCDHEPIYSSFKDAIHALGEDLSIGPSKFSVSEDPCNPHSFATGARDT